MRIVWCFLLLAISGWSSEPPEITKVEPPSWWQSSTWNPIRLMLRGKNLQGATLRTSGGFNVSNITVNAAGTYWFADLSINPSAKPGSQSFELRTSSGAVPVSFDLLPSLDRRGNFKGFSSDDVLYLIMPDRFANGDPSNDDPPVSKGLYDRAKLRYYHGGDLQGVIDHLPYLKSLGITALWLTPWYDNANHVNEKERYDNENITDYHGYGAVDFYGVEEHFGDLKKLQQLSRAAHALGIKLIQDQVANHTGPYHPWAIDPPTPHWFHGTPANHLVNDFQTWTIVDPNSGPETRRTTLDGWFVNILPDLNQDNPEARRYLIQNAIWWVGVAGLDGIRQDTMQYVPRSFWADWNDALHREFPHLKMAGEVQEADPALPSFFQGGRQRFDGIDSKMDMVFDFPLMFILRRVFGQGGPLRELAKLLAHDYLYERPRELVTMLGVHDNPRFASERAATPARIKQALTFLFATRGIPLLYYGDELGMTGGEDPRNRHDFPGGWKNDPSDGFTEAGRTSPQQAIWSHTQKLAKLRRGSVALRQGSTRMLLVSDKLLAFARIHSGETVIAIWNIGAEPAEIELDVSGLKLSGRVLEDRLGDLGRSEVKAGKLHLRLPAAGSAILF
jgi:glycosidase